MLVIHRSLLFSRRRGASKAPWEDAVDIEFVDHQPCPPATTMTTRVSMPKCHNALALTADIKINLFDADKRNKKKCRFTSSQSSFPLRIVFADI